MKKKKEPFHEWAERLWKKYGKYILIIICIVILLRLILGPGDEAEQELGYNEFIKTTQKSMIEKVIVQPQDEYTYKISGKFMDVLDSYEHIVKGKNFSLTIRKQAKFENLELEEFFEKYHIKFVMKRKGGGSGWLIFVLIYGGLIFLFYRLLRPMGKAMDSQNKHLDKYTKSSAKLADTKTRVTFKDVAGLKEAKEDLKETIDFLKDPTSFSKLGGRVPRGVLLVGPPGTGKTLLAKAVAGEARARFLYASGSEFVEMFVGVGARRVRDLFDRARQETPAIVFIDELDALARHRGAGIGGGHDEREQTLNQLLVELDGFDSRAGIILLGATNRPDILDMALLRPGRFDRKIHTNLPDVEDRVAILKVHTKNKPLAKNIRLKIIARGTPGFSGADLENLANEAALRAAKEKKTEIEMIDFESAKDKILMGAEKKIIITDEEKRTTAFHEAGHALITLLCPNTEPLHKVSIIPRGQALGITVQLPLKDKYTYSEKELEARLTVLMGGRVAEKMFLNKFTTGASNDIEVATGIARRMVCDWGMSSLGPLNFGLKQGEVFLGKELTRQQNYSEDTAKKIDKAVESLIDKANRSAKEILEKNKDKVEKLVELLLKKETLDGKEIKKALKIKVVQ